MKTKDTRGAIGGLGGILSLTGSAIFVKILGFLYKIPLSHILGDEGMGYYNGALSVYSIFFILCSCGIPKALSIILTRARIYQSKRSYKKTLILSSVFFSLFGVFMSLVLYILARPIASLIGVENADIALWYISPAIMFSTFSSICRGVLLSHDKVIPVGISESIEAMSKLLGGLMFVFLAQSKMLDLAHRSAFAVLGITLGGAFSFLYLLVSIFLNRKNTKEACGTGGFSLRSLFGSIIRIALPLTLTSLLFSVTSLLDVTLITHRLNESGVSSQDTIRLYGNYSTLVLPLISFVNSIVSAFSLSLFPRLSSFYETNDKRGFVQTVNSALNILFNLSLALCLGLFFFGEDYFTLLFPEESVSVGTKALEVICPSVIFVTLLTFINTALEAQGKTAAPLYTLGLGTLIKIPLAYFLIGNGKFGILGAAFSTVVSYMIGFLIGYGLLVKKDRDVRLRLYESIPSLLALGVSFSFGLLCKKALVTITNVSIFRIIPIFITVAIYIVFMLFFSKNLTQSMRKLSQYTK